MKIRTENDLQDAIDSELAWRKRELSAVCSNIASSRKFAKDTAIRAGITLLYAHWEGSIKNIAAYYLEYVAALKLPHGQLKPNFLAIELKNELKSFEESNKATIHTKIVRSVIQNQETKSNIPVKGIIKTNSNLNSGIFIEIMATLGLEYSEYESAFKLIDTVLLQKRNIIAHGEHLEALDLDEGRYNEIHDKVLNIIQMFADQISNAVSLKQYLRK